MGDDELKEVVYAISSFSDTNIQTGEVTSSGIFASRIVNDETATAYDSARDLAKVAVRTLMRRDEGERYMNNSVSFIYDASNPHEISPEQRALLQQQSARLVLNRREAYLRGGSGEIKLLEEIRDAAVPMLRERMQRAGLMERTVAPNG